MDGDQKRGIPLKPSFPDIVLSGLNELRMRGELCDVTLVAGTAKIRAHKVVLASCSPYFNAMFTGNLAERNQSEIEFPELDPLALKSLIEFAYTGKTYISQGNVQNLLPAANLLQLCKVKEDCCRYLSSQLDPSNSIGIARFAELHACHELAEKAEAYILQNFEDVCKYEEFLQFSENQVNRIIN